MYVVPELHQTKNQSDDKYASASNEFNYQTLGDSSTTSDEDSEQHTAPTDLQPPKICKSGSEQKLPTMSTFAYVNKYGMATKTQISPPKRVNKISPALESTALSPKAKNSEMICNGILVELAKSGAKKDGYSRLVSYDSFDSTGRSVPIVESRDLNKSDSFNEKHNNSLVQQTNYGTRINTSLTIQEPNIDITYEHVKYANLFSILCCWCFPFTGILGIIYARLTAKYYNSRDLDKARKYLKRSEWMLIATFFMGFTIIAIGFAYMQHQFMTSLKGSGSNFEYHSHGRFFPNFFPKK